MRVLTVKEAYDMAGVYHTDNDIERDIKFDQYFRQYLVRVTDRVTADVLAECRQENLDFLITKE
jgi:hypothetical protein